MAHEARLIHQLGFTKDLVLVEVGVDEGAFVQAVLLELKLLNSSVPSVRSGVCPGLGGG